MVVTTDKVIETQAFVPGTSAQKAEPIAFRRALMLSQGKKVDICTDSKYAFMKSMPMEQYGRREDC